DGMRFCPMPYSRSFSVRVAGSSQRTSRRAKRSGRIRYEMVQANSARPARMRIVAKSGAMRERQHSDARPKAPARLVDRPYRRTATALAQVLVDHVPVLRDVPAALHEPFAADDERGNAADAERLGLVGGIGHRLLERNVVERLDES